MAENDERFLDRHHPGRGRDQERQEGHHVASQRPSDEENEDDRQKPEEEKLFERHESDAYSRVRPPST